MTAVYFYAMIIHNSTDIIHRPKRIVSLVPSQTELLFDLDLNESVVGITKFCVYPAEWKKTKIIIGGTKNIHIEKIKELKPDLIIGNKEENIKEEIELLARNFSVWITDIASLDDALGMINELGELTKTETKATDIINQVKNNFKTIYPISKKINTSYLIWQNPYMTAGGDTFINDMMQHCGFTNVFASEKRYPAISIEDLKERNCELLLLASEPFPFRQRHLDKLQAQLPSANILLVDGEFFSWYGSRLVNAPFYFNTLIQQLRL